MSLNTTFSHTFYIVKSKKQSDGSCSIYLKITIEGTSVEYSTKARVKTDEWLEGKLLSSKGDINEYPNTVERKLLNTYHQLSAGNKKLTPQLLKDELLGVKQKEHSIISTGEYHNKQMEELLGKKSTKGTYKNYWTTLKVHFLLTVNSESFEGYTVGGVYNDTFAAINGCDSIRELTLTVLPVAMNTEVQTICDGESYNGYTATGIYTDTLTGPNGCDSLQVLDLTVEALPLIPTINIVGNVLSVADTYAAYQWYQDTTLLAGETSDTFTATVNGNYRVVVTNAAGCESTSATHNVTGIGISETIGGFGVRVYPNPTAGNLYLEVQTVSDAKWSVYNSIGLLLQTGLSTTITSIDMNSYADGVYYLIVSTENGVTTQRVLLAR